MKTKETSKKLNVSKVTVVNLDADSMYRLRGGTTGTPTTGTDITAVDCKVETLIGPYC